MNETLARDEVYLQELNKLISLRHTAVDAASIGMENKISWAEAKIAELQEQRDAAVGTVRVFRSAPAGGAAQEQAASRVRKVYTTEDAGIYRGTQDERIYKMYKAINGDHMLLKVLEADKFTKKGSFKYHGAANKRGNQPLERLTLEEAKKFGAVYGVCAMCGRTLTDETSIANGIGPICAGKVAF